MRNFNCFIVCVYKTNPVATARILGLYFCEFCVKTEVIQRHVDKLDIVIRTFADPIGTFDANFDSLLDLASHE